MLQPLTLASLAELDEGRIRVAFDQALKRAQSDCSDRPGVKAARKVKLTLTLTPVQDEDGGLDSCDVDFHFAEQIPARRSKPYNMRASSSGDQLMFNDLSPDNAAQKTIDQVPAGPKLKAVGDAR